VQERPPYIASMPQLREGEAASNFIVLSGAQPLVMVPSGAQMLHSPAPAAPHSAKEVVILKHS